MMIHTERRISAVPPCNSHRLAEWRTCAVIRWVRRTRPLDYPFTLGRLANNAAWYHIQRRISAGAKFPPLSASKTFTQRRALTAVWMGLVLKNRSAVRTFEYYLPREFMQVIIFAVNTPPPPLMLMQLVMSSTQSQAHCRHSTHSPIPHLWGLQSCLSVLHPAHIHSIRHLPHQR